MESISSWEGISLCDDLELLFVIKVIRLTCLNTDVDLFFIYNIKLSEEESGKLLGAT
jgi:hypothetical protein